MRYAVINPETKKVENIINADSSVVHGSGMLIVCCEGFVVEMLDDYNDTDGKFYHEGQECFQAQTIYDTINQAIDQYTLVLIEGGLL